MKCNIKNKVKFVKGLSDSITPFKTNIESIEYKVFTHICGGTQEFLVVNYDGGACSVRSCNGNSFSAIFEELAKLLDSGYYSEVENLVDIENNPDCWTKVNLEDSK